MSLRKKLRKRQWPKAQQLLLRQRQQLQRLLTMLTIIIIAVIILRLNSKLTSSPTTVMDTTIGSMELTTEIQGMDRRHMANGTVAMAVTTKIKLFEHCKI